MLFQKQLLHEWACTLIIIVSCINLDAQLQISNLLGGSSYGISTAVPFLTISPDAKANALGGSGVASSPDINAQHWNASKYAFMKERGGMSFNYTPWLREIGVDFDLAYLTSYYKPTENQAISASVRYFSLGEIISLTSDSYRLYEMAMDIGYSRQLSQAFSAGIVLRYIHSDIARLLSTYGPSSIIGRSVAMDIGAYYHKGLEFIPLPSNFAFGINISNLGSPISYSQEDQKNSIPANLRIGSSIEISPKQKNSFALNFDLNKLLVASPPIYDQAEVLRGMPAADNYFMELIQSFYDAPGISYSDGSYSTVLREELSELILNCGLEYSYAGLFCLRVGYFYESEFKGGRQYLSLGGGLKYKSWILDLSIYALGKQSTPLKNTVSISLSKSFS